MKLPIHLHDKRSIEFSINYGRTIGYTAKATSGNQTPKHRCSVVAAATTTVPTDVEIVTVPSSTLKTSCELAVCERLIRANVYRLPCVGFANNR